MGPITCLIIVVVVGFVLPRLTELIRSIVEVAQALSSGVYWLYQFVHGSKSIETTYRSLFTACFDWPFRASHEREKVRCAGVTVGAGICSKSVDRVARGEVPACALHQAQRAWLVANT